MMIDADGALRAYHPDDASGLDRLDHAGAPGNWWGIVTDDGTPGGEPVVQGDGDPAPGFYVSQTSLVDPDEGARPIRGATSTRSPFRTWRCKRSSCASSAASSATSRG